MAEFRQAPDWDSLEVTRGSAVALPDLLQDLRSSEQDVRLYAAEDLAELLIADGQIFEAAAYAVPFLLDHVSDRGALGRVPAFGLLSRLVCGDEEVWFGGRRSVAGLRGTLDRLNTMSDDDYQRWNEQQAAALPNERARERAMRAAESRSLAAHRQTLQHHLASVDAVRAGLPLFIACLYEDDWPIRCWGAKLLSWFGDEEPDRSTAATALTGLLDRESRAKEDEDWALATAVLAAGLVAHPDDTGLVEGIERLRDHPEPPVWAAAAMATAWVDRNPPRPVIEALYDCLFEGPEESGFPFMYGDMTQMAATVLARLDPQSADDRVAALVVRWSVAGPEGDDVFAQAVLSAAFPQGALPSGARFNDLTTAQRSVVEAFATRTFADRSLAWTLRKRYNLPARDEA